MRCRALVFAAPALAALAVAGCGTPAPDVFIVNRAGTIAGAKLRLRVIDDGTVYCNGRARTLPSKMLVDTRALADDLGEYYDDPAKPARSLPARPGSTLRYDFRIEPGVLRFSDNSLHQPPAFYQAALLVRKIAQGPCGLPR